MPFRPVLLLLLTVLCFAGLAGAQTVPPQTTAGEITGTVKDGARRAIKNVEVRVQGGPVLVSSRTNNTGVYSLPDLIPGTYVIQAIKPGYVPVLRGNVVVSEGLKRTENFTLEWADAATGGVEILLDDPLGDPVEDAEVRMFRNGVFLTSITSDEAGSAIFPGLAIGTYNVEIEAVGFRDAVRGNLRVVAGQHASATIKLRRDAREVGTITGSVQDLNGTPLRNAQVKLVGGPATGQARTNGLGQFTIQRLPPDRDYSLQASATGYAPQTLENIVVTVSQATTVNFRLLENARLKGSITGLIKNTNNLPVALATVTITAGPAAGNQAVSGPDGRYTFTGLDPSASYALQATSPGHSPEGVAAVNVVAGRTTVINFLLRPQITPPGSIGGNVTNRETGAPVEGVLVEVVQGMSVGLSALTNAGGSYVIEGLIPGDNYTLRFTREGYNQVRIPFIQVMASARATVDAELPEVRIAVGIISGKVVEFGNRPLAGVKVQLFLGPSSPLQTTTNNQGSFTFTNLRIGTNYAIRASKDGYGTEEKRAIRVQDGQTVPVTIELRQGAATGALEGVVFDLLQRPINNATIRVIDGPARPADARTNAQGRYRMEDLPRGRYIIDVFANGFPTQRRTNVHIFPEATTFLNVQLTP